MLNLFKSNHNRADELHSYIVSIHSKTGIYLWQKSQTFDSKYRLIHFLHVCKICFQSILENTILHLKLKLCSSWAS